MERGKYTVLEGIDGTGKSTQVLMLSRRLREEYGVEVVSTFEPGATKVGAEIRKIVKSDTERHPATNLWLFSADRAELVNSVISPAINSGTWVNSDRNWISTVAYQGFGEGVDTSHIKSLTHKAMG